MVLGSPHTHTHTEQENSTDAGSFREGNQEKDGVTEALGGRLEKGWLPTVCKLETQAFTFFNIKRWM